MEGGSSPTTFLLPSRGRQSRTLLNPVFLILLLPTLALIIVFLLIFSFISHTSNIKIKGSDYLNIILLLSAIFCGVFCKRNDKVSHTEVTKPHPSVQWYDYPDRMVENSSLPETRNPLRRNSSYPDMSQTQEPETGYNQSRFFDDVDIKVIRVDTFEVKKVNRSDRKKSGSSTKEVGTSTIADSKRKCKRRHKIKNIHEETKNIPPPPLPPPLPPLPFYGLFKRENNTKRVHSLSEKGSPTSPPSIFNDIFKTGSKNKWFQDQSMSAPQPPPPLPPPPSSIFYNMFKSGSKSKRFQNPSTSAPPSSSIFDDIFKTGSKIKRFQNQSRPVPPPPPPPLPPPPFIFNSIFKSESKSKRFGNKSRSSPPPPPPPPPSIFNNMFQTGSKSKRFQKQSISTLPLPPPPPPLPPATSSIFNNIFKSGSKSKRFQNQSRSPPPLPSSSIFNNIFKSGNKSNLFKKQSTSVPPPPPPLPLPSFPSNNLFKTGSKNKRYQSVFAPPPSSIFNNMFKYNSKPSRPPPTPPLSQFRMPELEDFDLGPSKETPGKMDGGDGSKNSVMCPTPDVNMKADSFIARLKGEWRLEKMNSVRENNNMSPYH